MAFTYVGPVPTMGWRDPEYSGGSQGLKHEKCWILMLLGFQTCCWDAKSTTWDVKHQTYAVFKHEPYMALTLATKNVDAANKGFVQK